MKKSCYYFNWGGGEEGRASYPREYGARCEYWKVFCTPFNINYKQHDMCKGCPHYTRKKRKPSK